MVHTFPPFFLWVWTGKLVGEEGDFFSDLLQNFSPSERNAELIPASASPATFWVLLHVAGIFLSPLGCQALL